MDSRFKVNDTPRQGAPEALAETPLVTIAWRAMRSDHKRLSEDRARMDNALADAAESVFRLRAAARLARTSPKRSRARMIARDVVAAADRLEAVLGSLGVVVLAPEGEVFSHELMEVFENVAQTPDQDAREPRVAEVIRPAILRDGRLALMGKAVIAVPSANDDAAG